MGTEFDIWNITVYKIFTDSAGNVNVQHSVNGMYVFSSGEEHMMEAKKEMIDCSSPGVLSAIRGEKISK